MMPDSVRAAEESCTACDVPVVVSGDFSHFKIRDGLEIQRAAGNEAAFREEIWGRDFSITVPNLPAGQYTLIIGETENFFKSAGQRLFDITAGDTVIASKLDVFAAAGGMRTVLYVTNVVDHLDDSLRGPLSVRFTGRKNNAKFNTFEIRSAAGKVLISTRAADLSDALAATAGKVPVVTDPPIWREATRPVAARVADLVRRLSLAEKVAQIRNNAPAIPRLGVPAYNYWNEALHGVARNGFATVFPQAIGMAATWDTMLIHEEGDVIATEGRAKYNEYTRTHHGDSKSYTGLTFWSPNLNIFRDPRWGRGQETYGEDTLLTGTIGVAFIHGLQGGDPNYVKAMACAKHFAVHSGPEPKRHRFDADPPERDFYETYLPHFEMAVREGQVGGVMGAYNAIYGQPACANPRLLTDILRKQWGFDGYIVSDCGAIHDIYNGHHFVPTAEAAAAAAVKAGCDICCGGDYNALLKAVQTNLIAEADIDTAVAYAFKARFRLGLFDPADKVPFSKIPITENDTPAHAAVALKAAGESIVLLKNNGLLPLDRAKIRHLAVIGANATSVSMLLGNYNGEPSHPITILEGLKEAAGTNMEVTYTPGCPLAVRKDGSNRPTDQMLAEALAAAKAADVVVYVGGISPEFEGEEFGGLDRYDGYSGGDRLRIELPPVQEDLLKALAATGVPVVYVNCSGSAMAMPWEAEHLPALVQAWYPGEQGGRAVAQVLLGDLNPGGRLPVTFYRSTADLPDFEDYSMSNRTYRYFSGQPLFAFGHGLSYSTFSYQKAALEQASLGEGNTVKLTFTVGNTGSRDGDEVAQVYFRHLNSVVVQPKEALCGFTRLHLAAGASTEVTTEIAAARFRYWDTTRKRYVVEPGDYELLIGAASDDIRLRVPFKITSGE